jgi:hypothetical protein
VSAVYAFMEWDGSGPEPTVEFEVSYVPPEISISQACGLVWNCTDIIPGHLFDWLIQDADLDIRGPTYAACARATRDIVREWDTRNCRWVYAMSEIDGNEIKRLLEELNLAPTRQKARDVWARTKLRVAGDLDDGTLERIANIITEKPVTE